MIALVYLILFFIISFIFDKDTAITIIIIILLSDIIAILKEIWKILEKQDDVKK